MDVHENSLGVHVAALGVHEKLAAFMQREWTFVKM